MVTLTVIILVRMIIKVIAIAIMMVIVMMIVIVLIVVKVIGFHHPAPKGLSELKGNQSYQGDCRCEEGHLIIQLLRGFGELKGNESYQGDCRCEEEHLIIQLLKGSVSEKKMNLAKEIVYMKRSILKYSSYGDL